MAVSETLLTTGATTKPARTYIHSIGYLRASLVALVVAHHASLAYHTFAPPAAASLVAEPRCQRCGIPAHAVRSHQGETLADRGRDHTP